MGENDTPQRKRAGLRELFCFKTKQKKTKKSNATLCKEYRERRKLDLARDLEAKDKNRERAKKHRQKPLSEEDLLRRREQDRLRAKKYRDSKKLEKQHKPTAPSTSTPKTRKSIKEQREYWRTAKQKQREQWSSQKWRRHREKNLAHYYKRRETEVNEADPQTRSGCGKPQAGLDTANDIPSTASRQRKQSADTPTTPISTRNNNDLLNAAFISTPNVISPTDQESVFGTPISTRNNDLLNAAFISTPVNSSTAFPPLNTVSALSPQPSPSSSTATQLVVPPTEAIVSATSTGTGRRPTKKRKKTNLLKTSFELVAKNAVDRVNELKKRRSKDSIAQKKAFQALFHDVSPLKSDLYTRKTESESVKKLTEFLEDQAVPVPGKSVSSTEQNPKKILPKKLAWIHTDFTRQHPQHKVSLRTMYRHIPKHILTNTHHIYRQCLCETCTNIDLKLEAINPFIDNPIKGRDEISEMTICPDGETELDCYDRNCSKCGIFKIEDLFHVPDPSILVKWKSWDMVQKETGKRRELVEKEGLLSELISLLLSNVNDLSKHLFTFRWQYLQFKFLKANMSSNTALAVFDFSENFLCRHQDEVQSAHWSYKQVTVHPCVLYYPCHHCDEQIIDYVVVLSDDLNHDAHFVKHVTDIVKSHLSKVSEGRTRKLVIFSDGCSSQYKSKLPFYYLAKDSTDIEVHRCFFGSRHGKSSSDSCGGTIKTLVSKDVAAGLCIVQGARAMHAHCSKFHTLPSSASSSPCVHKKRCFYLIESDDIDRSIKSSELKTVSGTQKLHDIKRVNSSTLQKRNLSCFCHGCAADLPCVNSKFVQPWEYISIPDVTDSDIEVLSGIADRQEFFLELQKLLTSDNISFQRLKSLSSKVHSYLDLFQVPESVRYIEEEKCRIDHQAMALFPQDYFVHQQQFPVVTVADGNCLPRALSVLLFGTEDFHVEMRCRIAITLALNVQIFTDNSVWSCESDIFDFLCEVSNFGPSADVLYILQQEALESAHNGKFMGLWQLFAAAFFMKVKIKSIFPNKGWNVFIERCNRVIIPPNVSDEAPVYSIVWSTLRKDMNADNWVPNHFVPVLSIVRPKTVETASLDDGFVADVSRISEDASFVPKVMSTYKVDWNGKLFIAEVCDVDLEESLAYIKFMEEKGNFYSWPEKEDFSWEPFTNFHQEVVLHLSAEYSTQRKQWYGYSAVL